MAEKKDSSNENWKITVKWSGKEIIVNECCGLSTVSDLKRAISEQTRVQPERQKLLGIRFPPGAESERLTLQELKLKNGAKIMMMGSREEVVAAAQEIPQDLPEVVDDFDIEFNDIPTQSREEFLAKVDRRIRDYPINIQNEPRPGKKLIVLDIDGTLFDNWSVGETGSDLMRPYLHQFLTTVYQHYDMMIWSATNMVWIETKLSLLGVTSNPCYKFVCFLDSLATISVETPKKGLVKTKPLGLIWGRFSDHYNPSNTILVDDCRSNFLMNPRNGLRVKCFRNAHTNQATDSELLDLKTYLVEIVNEENVQELDLSKWRKSRKLK